MKYKIYFIPLFIFIILNLFVIFNYGYYHDDWFFFNFNNENFITRSRTIWLLEGVQLHRYPNVIFYIAASALPNKELLYFSLAVFGLIICYQIYDILNFILKKKNISTDLNRFGLLTLISVWYFFPFNIGGQIWSADLHVKVSMLFFLIHYQFLVRQKLLHSLIFLFIAFSSYEMFYLIYIPLSSLIYFLGIIEKNFFKKYLFYSLFIQIYFIFDRKRDYYEFEILDFFQKKIINIFRFFYAIYSSLISFLNIYYQLIIFSPLIYFIYKINNKKIFFKIFIILVITLGLNSLILSGGHYGFTGQGVFSRSFYYAAFCIFLFSFLLFILSQKKIKYLIILYFISFGVTSFYFESKSWIKSWEIQQEVFTNNKINYIENEFGKNNLVFFFGPCMYNGVEVFHAPWDIGRSIKENNPLSQNNFTVLTNWDLEYNENKKIIGVHNFYYSYSLDNYNQIILWDYFNDKISFVKATKNFNYYDLKQFNKLHDYRSCEIRSKKYSKNLIDYKRIYQLLF